MKNKATLGRITRSFVQAFDQTPELLLRSPGRINLIGEHTDYNMGYVVPSAIDKSVYFAFRKNGKQVHRLVAADRGETIRFPVVGFEKVQEMWGHFLQGGLWKLEEEGHQVGGVDLVFGSDLPIGAGLSSSSALSCGFLEGLNTLFGLGIPPFDIAMLGHYTEREYVGLKGGIMDQFANMLSRPDHFILLDCRSRDYSHHQLILDAYDLVLINTRVEHKLTESDYNTRSAESAQAAEILQSGYPEIASLRDVTLEMAESMKARLGDVLYRRAAYVIRENARVLDTIQACHRNDYEAVGKNLFASHAGLRDEYEVSCAELDYLVEQAMRDEGVLGARMMGGGFGGCTINLVAKGAKENFLRYTLNQYRQEFGIEAEVIPVSLTGSTEVIEAEGQG